MKGLTMTVAESSSLRLPALQIQQGPDRLLYQFAVDGKLLDRFATVSRISRNSDSEVDGYQRPEALSHIASIRRYIESPGAMVPNSLVIAFDERVKFTSEGAPVNGVCHGWIEIPIDDGLSPSERPGWIVDGQQRTAAVRDARVDAFPMAVTAFITSDQDEQRQQFILVNSVKPLSKSLIYELLPSTDTQLPPQLARRRLSSILLNRLNYDTNSPFFQRIKTPTNPDGFIKDNSVMRMLDNSISDGVLYHFRDSDTGLGDIETMIELVSNYWIAVSHVFSGDWESTPRKSRLVHGVGIVSMGYLMDAIADRLIIAGPPSVERFGYELTKIASRCRWSNGFWDLGPGVLRKWNDLQNTPRDVQLITNQLLGLYRTVASQVEPSGRPFSDSLFEG
jgi:DGQHR domain-containing protein